MTTLAANTSTTFTINVDQVITLTGASVTLTATLTNQKGGDVVVKFAGQKLRDTPVFSAGSTGTVTLVNGPNPLTYVVSDTAMGNVVATTNPLTGNTIGIYGQVNGVPNQVIALGSSSVVLPTFQPYKIAGFGDSRVDQNLATPDLGSVNTSFGSEITPMLWACALLGDAAYTRSYGIGGDVASNWSAASAGTNRFTYGRTIADCVRSDLDGVIIQYGVNDARGAVSAALIAGYLQGLCTEIMKSGKLVFFESIMPPSSTYTSAAAVKAITDAANVLMAAWLAQFPKQAIYMNVNAAITDASGWMLPAYTDDGLHLTQKGALAIARVEAPLMRTLLPARSGTFPGPDSKNPNMLNLVSPSAFINIDTGTVSASAVASGLDATNGYYTEFTWTPSAASVVARFTLTANFLTSVLPVQSMLGNELLSGSCRLILDDGNGGVPNALALYLRQKVWGTVQADWGSATLTTGTYDLGAALDIKPIVPKMANTAAIGSITPTSTSGYTLAIVVASQQNGVPVRLRVYNAQLRQVGYHNKVLTAASFALPATTVAYTNASYGKQQVTVGGGVVTVLALNGVTTGLTAGVFVLNPGDTLTPTYSSAPTWTVNQIN